MFKNMRADGLVHPAERSKPALRADCVELFDAFRFLGARRLWNEVGPQAIEEGRMSAWLAQLGFVDDELLKGCRLVAMLDDLELKHFYDKRKQESK